MTLSIELADCFQSPVHVALVVECTNPAIDILLCKRRLYICYERLGFPC